MKRFLVPTLLAILLCVPFATVCFATDSTAGSTDGFVETHTMADALANAKQAGGLIIIDYAMDN